MKDIERRRSPKLDKMLGKRVEATIKLAHDPEEHHIVGILGLNAGFLCPAQYYIMPEHDVPWYFFKNNVKNIKVVA